MTVSDAAFSVCCGLCGSPTESRCLPIASSSEDEPAAGSWPNGSYATHAGAARHHAQPDVEVEPLVTGYTSPRQESPAARPLGYVPVLVAACEVPAAQGDGGVMLLPAGAGTGTPAARILFEGTLAEFGHQPLPSTGLLLGETGLGVAAAVEPPYAEGDGPLALLAPPTAAGPSLPARSVSTPARVPRFRWQQADASARLSQPLGGAARRWRGAGAAGGGG